jgi:hypothetical protein
VEKPDAPEMLLRTVGNVITKHGQRDEALDYWSKLKKRSKDRQTLDLADRELGKLSGRDR